MRSLISSSSGTAGPTPKFNGFNPIGPHDLSNPKYFVNLGNKNNPGNKLQLRVLDLQPASTASQATGPPLSDVEMSFAGRTWPDMGKKLTRGGLIGPSLTRQCPQPTASWAPTAISPGKV